MPRVNYGLTREQKEAREVQRISKELLDRMNEKRGRENKGKQEFAAEVGVSFPTWKRWNNRGMGKSDLETVIIAAMRAGVKIEVVG